MKYISDEDLVKWLENRDEWWLDDALTPLLKELDQLTVSKLRPMSEANKEDGESECLLYLMGYSLPFLGYWTGTEWDCGFDKFTDDDFSGWLPLPIYKPEE